LKFLVVDWSSACVLSIVFIQRIFLHIADVLTGSLVSCDLTALSAQYC